MALALLASCSADPDQGDPGPGDRVSAFITAWQGMDFDAAADYTTAPAAAAVMLDEVTGDLRPDQLTITAGDLTRTGPTQASTTVTFTWQLPDAGSWSYPATWTWKKDRDWELDWSPSVIHPKLGERQTLAARTTPAEPGVLVDRNNNQIVQPVTVYSIVLLPAMTPDVAAAAAALASVLSPIDPTVTPDSISAGVAQSQAEAAAATQAPTTGSDGTADGTPPDDPDSVGYTVTNLREADFRKIKPQLDAIAGLSFPSQVRNLPPTRDFAKAILAQVDPVAAPLMRGTDGWSVVIVDSTGGVLETLDDHPAVAGQRVTLTLDSGLQQAAEAAIADQDKPAVLLMMQPSTGELLAVAQNAAANAQGTPALTGQYPPGSTFKIVTATAAMERGLSAPTQPIDCPGVFTVQGRAITNAHDLALGTVDLTEAFAQSCNTTFAGLSTQMPADALPLTAAGYGIGLDFVMQGAVTLTGKVPDADSVIQRAENGFGQGQVLVTPFGELLMVATAARGSMPMPVLIRGTTTTVDRQPPEIPAAANQGMKTLMAAVVASGTGAGLTGYGDTHAKTGTAEFQAEDGSIHAHAWTVGFRGDMAFAAMIIGGEDSAKTNQIAAELLATVPA
jgi:cell division protein FtsI/penicillin-binding protein 2